MSIEAEDEHRAEQLSAVFALLTGKLEDAATFAANGQSRHSDAELLSYANHVAELASEAATIASAVAALLSPSQSGAAE